MRRGVLIAVLVVLAGGAAAQVPKVIRMPEQHRMLLNNLAEAMSLSTACGRYEIAKDAMIAMLLRGDVELKAPGYREWIDARVHEMLTRLRLQPKDVACALALENYGPDGRAYKGLVQTRRD